MKVIIEHDPDELIDAQRLQKIIEVTTKFKREVILREKERYY